MEVERYSHVLHLVSNVEARLKPGCDALDALRSIFPAGTLSGAPKVRAMQLIAEAEKERRGLYGGAVGYLGYDGNLDTAITIRSAVIKDDRSTSPSARGSSPAPCRSGVRGDRAQGRGGQAGPRDGDRRGGRRWRRASSAAARGERPTGRSARVAAMTPRGRARFGGRDRRRARQEASR
jgi:hypothetical protein